MKTKIDKVWKKILEVTPPKADKRKWSLYPAHRIKQSFDLSEFSKKTGGEVAKYIRENIKSQEAEIKFLKKWSPKVYHKYTYWSLELQNKAMNKILNKLSKALNK